jgi:hypothetical protein
LLLKGSTRHRIPDPDPQHTATFQFRRKDLIKDEGRTPDFIVESLSIPRNLQGEELHFDDNYGVFLRVILNKIFT